MLDGCFSVPPDRVPLSDAGGVIEAVGPRRGSGSVAGVADSFNPLWFGGPQRKPGQNYHTDIDRRLADYVEIDEQRLVSMPERLGH